MATGDQADMAARMRAVLPLGWFGDAAPVLTALLTGIGVIWARLYACVVYARQQTRIATATEAWLDLAALDYLGAGFGRRLLESDAAFRARIMAEITRIRNTRPAIVSVLSDLTGRAPVIFEPMQTGDTGGWDIGLGFDAGGGWGDLGAPFQAFITARRPAETAVPLIGGYGQGMLGFDVAGAWTDGASIVSQITDADITAAVNSVRPAGVTYWMRITD